VVFLNRFPITQSVANDLYRTLWSVSPGLGSWNRFCIDV
jgi:hypothetical protein